MLVVGCWMFPRFDGGSVTLREHAVLLRPLPPPASRGEEENGEGEIVIELEECQVQRVGLDQADTDEFAHHIGHPRIVTNQLFVKNATLQSRDAANDDQQRFARARRLSKAIGQIVVNPVAGGFDFLAVIQHALFAVFGGRE